ncbi:hypothetical protein FJR48_02085 [Sulfurimonas lithotrophica]|uniref:Uncharacterized protein n=1 Tax=Sulfurimonas lithotrophica TaxID=2590022 RepID=A0A5P8NYS3_9BACT|nr:hypothetical protein [Sulfurimonas lithotrophica]QFR48579.1 hypothetical protein FJR48_02085 [Sulfurimonas lithotrophica]
MKIIFTCIFLLTLGLASDKADNIRIKILERIIGKLSLNEQTRVWSDNKNILNTLSQNSSLKTTPNCIYANIIILQNQNKLPKECSSKAIFVLDYKLLSQIPQSFGAFFWKKGRPNIVILKPRIQKQSIKISSGLKSYLEEKVW